MTDEFSEVTMNWNSPESFERWWKRNVREFNRMAAVPPPDPRNPEVVLNPEWHRIADHIDRWKAARGL